MPVPTRCIGIVGPFQTGKTSLLEALLHRSGAVERMGKGQSRVGDTSPEARAHAMSTEANVATAEFLEERFAFVDCPGSIEFGQDMRDALPAMDAAIVVCESDEKKVPALGLVLRQLEEAGVPRLLFINKIDTATQRLRDTVAMLQPASRTPLLMRQIPIWQDGAAASTSRWSAPSSTGPARRASRWRFPRPTSPARRTAASPCWSGSPIGTTG